ncbi:tetratricopeptide repeat protein [Parabacteroides distasonis]|uniref:Tetratricopeptide repeat protein n=1 Tax=Parabacteroides distasonis TaxID=823 RepID=A0AAW6F1H8_PARDI|nr:hypothetical protein [Parabacteroides distasonis]MCS2607666.1 hypothetical protein [Parabacteroides distasonis]MDB9137107.1 hypothetical protein [Parabacteroides distasonis]MDB9144023.1 hypothetical protein [Parabacteroides distasonis]MDB9148486.1 hypothetical protein [Parabacteroides distasonis]
MSDKLLARWCMLSGKVADTLYTDLPYVQQLRRAQAYYESHGTGQEQARIGLYLGRSYVEDKDNELAMKAYLQALDIALRCQDYNQAGYICSYMGDLYHFDGDYLLGKDKYKKAEQYFRKVGNMRSAAFALRDVGRMYVFADSSEVGLRYLLEADTIIAELGDSSDIGYISNGIGNVYSVLGNIELAKQYLWKSINVSELDNAPDYSALAGVYIEEGDFKNARLCLEQANIIPTLNENTHISIIYNYYELEKAEGNIENALTYLEQYNEAADSILALQNKANIVKTEKAYNHLKISLENTQLKMDKQWTFILLVTSITVCLLLLFVYQLQMNKKNKRIYVQQIDIEQKNIELLKLQNSLNIKQRELQDLFDKLSKEDELLNISYSRAKLEERYERTKQEEKSIIQRIAEQRNNLFLSSMIARKVIKLSQKVIPGTTKSPLSEKYWRNIITQANEVYPSLEKKFSEFNMTLADLRYCYLVLFHLDTISEAILLNIQPDSVNKRRQRVRQKLGIIGEELDLYTYIINMM